MFDESDLVFSYSRAQAIEDGVLVDVTAKAKEAGFRFPVALTRAAYERSVTLPKDYPGAQDEAGRLWDVLWLARMAIMRIKDTTLDVAAFDILVVNPKTHRPERLDLKVHCGPGDTAEPVITIMLPDED